MNEDLRAVLILLAFVAISTVAVLSTAYAITALSKRRDKPPE